MIKDKLRFQLLVSALLIMVGSGLLIAGFCVPPVGIIDHSVLIAFGEILTFVGAIFGIDYSYKIKVASKIKVTKDEKKGDKKDDNE